MPSPLRKDSRDMECDGPIGPFDDPGLVSQSSETDDGTSLEIWTPYEPLRRARDRMHLELVKGKEVPKACCEDKSSLADLAQRQQCGGATTPTNEKDESDSSSTLSSPPASVANPPLAGESPGRSRCEYRMFAFAHTAGGSHSPRLSLMTSPNKVPPAYEWGQGVATIDPQMLERQFRNISSVGRSERVLCCSNRRSD